jgi:lysophospholipase L1-like esterase
VIVLALAALAGAGCGGDSESSTSTTAPSAAATGSTASTATPDQGSKSGKVVVAALGDSITAGSPIWDPDPAVRKQIGPQPDERSQYEYWASKADARLEFRNCGVFGERTDQIANRLSDCADGADVLVIQGGINDIAQGRPVDQAAASLRGMVGDGLDMGLDVTITDVLPWNNGHPGADEPIAQLNREIERIGADEDVPVLHFHDTLESPDEPGTMSLELTIDGDHPSVAGYRLLGERAFELPRPSG